MRLFTMLLLCTGCLGPNNKTPIETTTQDQNINTKIKTLEEQLDRADYESGNVHCFTVQRDICYLNGYAHCADDQDSCFENKSSCIQRKTSCIKSAKKKCFDRHEQCIIDNYHKWQTIKKLKGYK